jgi:pimeloyl-ACP methyl ester carboxylesterase
MAQTPALDIAYEEIGQDVIDLAEALKIQRFAVAGYDWGGRAAAIAAALLPVPVGNLVAERGSSPRKPTKRPRRHLTTRISSRW